MSATINSEQRDTAQTCFDAFIQTELRKTFDIYYYYIIYMFKLLNTLNVNN